MISRRSSSSVVGYRGLKFKRAVPARNEPARIRAACQHVAEGLESRMLLSSIVTTGSASVVSATGATLNATVNPQGSTAAAEFQYSTNAAFTSAALGG